MAKMKDRDYYRLTLPGQLIRNLSTHHPYLADAAGDVDDLNLVTVVANDWLNNRSGSSKALNDIHDPTYPHINTYALPYDIENGPHVANLIKRNPDGVVALYVCPTELKSGDKFLDGDCAGMIAYGAAKNFPGENSQRLLKQHPDVDCKYISLGLQICDPKTPHKNDLIIGEARGAGFNYMTEGKTGVSLHSEGYAAVSALIEYVPEATLMVLDTGGLYREYEKIEKRLKYWTSEAIRFYTGVAIHEESELRFEY